MESRIEEDISVRYVQVCVPNLLLVDFSGICTYSPMRQAAHRARASVLVGEKCTYFTTRQYLIYY
jgi:hypothetical protein